MTVQNRGDLILLWLLTGEMRRMTRWTRYRQPSEMTNITQPENSWKKPSALTRVPVLDEETCANDSGDIGGHSDGNAGQGQNHPACGGFFEEVAVEDCQGKQAHQGTDTATGFGYLQLHDRQFNDVAILQDRNAEQGQDHAREAGGEQLQRESDLVEDDGGKWDREHQDKEGKQQSLQHGAAEESPDKASQQKDE